MGVAFAKMIPKQTRLGRRRWMGICGAGRLDGSRQLRREAVAPQAAEPVHGGSALGGISVHSLGDMSVIDVFDVEPGRHQG